MWRDDPFSQRSKTTKRTVGWRLEAMGKMERVGQNLKRGGRQYKGVFIK